jgi:hypothetical protein
MLTSPHREQFDTAYMRALFDAARIMAKNGFPWTKLPPGYDARPRLATETKWQGLCRWNSAAPHERFVRTIVVRIGGRLRWLEPTFGHAGESLSQWR